MRTAALWLASAVALIAATPPAWFPGAEFAVLPGLAGFYALTERRRAGWLCYALGFVHVAWFSFSVRHVLFGAYVAIVLIGGLYFALAVLWTRRLGRLLPGPIAFGAATAGICWLRANMPEIYYPHGQFAHDLWQWPALLGSVAWGGEVLANFLLGALAAGAVDVARGAGRRTAIGLAAVFAITLLPCPSASTDAPAAPVRIAALEPGVAILPIAWRPEHREDWREAYRRRLVLTTRSHVEGVDLVLWPEASAPFVIAPDPAGPRIESRASSAPWRPFPLPRGTRLAIGSNLVHDDARETPVAALFDADGALVGWHEKRAVVPGGEFVPFYGILPDFVVRWVVSLFGQSLGSLPNCRPGEPRDALALADGMRFGAMLCYDNAFPEVARSKVGRGARFLVVLSNESWYRGGGELAQMRAMTAFRALETDTPIVRSTIDGPTLAMGADGRTLGALEPAWPEPRDSARILTVDLEPGPGRERPLAWLHDLCRWVIALSGLCAIAARRRRAG